MRIIVWQEQGKVAPWRQHHPKGYIAGDLVEHMGTEYVCVTTHGNAVFSPSESRGDPNGFNLWFPVKR